MTVRPALSARELLVLASVAGIGGVAGSVARYGTQFGLGILGQPAWVSRVVVNLVGAALAGWFVGRVVLPEATNPLTAADRPLRWREHVVLTGLLGGFTTVSGFAWDVAAMAQAYAEWPRPVAAPRALAGESPLVDLALVLLSNGVVGVAAAGLGLAIGRRCKPRLPCEPGVP